jgi:hypothetical protein
MKLSSQPARFRFVRRLASSSQAREHVEQEEGQSQ